MKLLTIYFSFMLFSCAGSFIGVCYDRIPRGEQIWKGRSHCDNCKRKLGPSELVPVFSILFLRGHCKTCNCRIPATSTVIEIATAALSTLPIIVYGLSAQGIAFGLVTCILIEIALLDMKTMEISNLACILIGTAGIVLMFIKGSYISSLIGAVCISVPFLILALCGGMGMGDVKLMAAVGILLGWEKTLLAAFLGILVGCVAATIIKFKTKREWKSEIAFGPYLCIGTYLAMLCGDSVISWYLSLL